VPVTVSHPVQTLRDHATRFEAALSVCLANPKPRAVHKLRTESRRLEAQIVLLEALRGLPRYRKAADKVMQQVARFRRAAGRVRDLDVQSKMLQDHGKRKPHPDQAAPTPEELAQFAHQRTDDLAEMIATRVKRREELAAELVALIEKRQAKVSAALEALLTALKAAGNLRLPAADLVRIADKRFTKQRALRVKEPSPTDLHSIRKAAKQARYLAETSGAVAATEKAKRYEHLQEAGGKWHDWLDLTHDARKELGRKHAAAAEFAVVRDRRLVTYRSLLDEFRSHSNGKNANGNGHRTAPSKAAPNKA
jgi:CHAD domain-containing protein